MQSAIETGLKAGSGRNSLVGRPTVGRLFMRLGVDFIAVIVLQELYSPTGMEAGQPPVQGGDWPEAPYRMVQVAPEALDQ